MHSYQHYVKLLGKRGGKNLVFIAAVVIGGRNSKKMKLISHRRHKNDCTCGRGAGNMKDLFPNPSAGEFKV